MPSILSRIPPWPGNKLPVFLIEDFLFKYEKKRSPNCTLIETTNPIKIFCIDEVLNKYFNKVELIRMENKMEPKLPVIVLLGLILVNLGPLNILPIINPPISDDEQIIKIINSMILKWTSLVPKIKINKNRNM